jgi:AbrB family looped-hinge helix DNA binding protein
VIPKEIRDKLGLNEGAGIEIEIQGQDLIIRKSKVPSWRKWRGALKGSRALQDHEREHREEVDGDAKGT